MFDCVPMHKCPNQTPGLPFSCTSGAINGLLPALFLMSFPGLATKLQAKLKSANFHVFSDRSTLS